MHRRTSLLRVLQVDYIAMFSGVATVTIWLLWLLTLYLSPEDAPWFRYIAPTVTVVGLAGVLWRYRSIQSLLADGIAAAGTVTSVGFWRDRGRVEYVFDHVDDRWAAGNPVHKCKYTSALEVGQKVVVVFDRSNPKRAHILDLYV